ncbi:hypothetical protein B9H02_08930 [Prosthecochloris sp. HL-130-GSB]|nr:hypothetical protein B9H02_08930 [Prosthecochloris sp. HL-130-GSB]
MLSPLFGLDRLHCSCFLRTSLLCSLLTVTSIPLPSFLYAGLPGTTTKVGDRVTDPGSGVEVEVLEVFYQDDDPSKPVQSVQTTHPSGDEYKVLRIVTQTSEGSIYPINPENETGENWKVTSIIKQMHGGTEYPDSLVMKRPDPDGEEGDELEKKVDVSKKYDLVIPTVDPPLDARTIDPPPSGAGDSANRFNSVSQAKDGKDGRNGYSVKIYFPWPPWSKVIGYRPTSGGSGDNEADFLKTFSENYGSIQTATHDLPGIKVVRIGGDGGDGGNSISAGGYAGGKGGRGGDGGDVEITSYVDITTSGNRAPGIFVLSNGGKGGKGGAGYIASKAGEGGRAGDGGTVKLFNYGLISTSGTLSHGLLAQSLGGFGGGGGDSWGL